MSRHRTVLAIAIAAALGLAIYLAVRGRGDGPKAATASPPAPRGDGPASTGATPSAPAPTGARGSAATRPPAKIKRLDPTARERMLAQIEAARARRDRGPSSGGGSAPALPPPELSKDYIRAQVRALIPLIQECYEQALEAQPGLGGKLVVEFAIGGEPEVGGLVETSEVDAEASTITHPGMVECVRETMYAAEFVAPAEGGRVVVRYPFEFSSGE